MKSAYEREHDRELQKHEWRPGDNPILGKYTDEPLPSGQRYAVAELIGYCEGIISSGALSPAGELALREHVAKTLVAFNMPSRAERVPA